MFTSGGTESINAAIKGVAFAQADAGGGERSIRRDDPAAIASALAYIANAPGLTGQCLALDDTGAGGVIPSLA